MSIAPGVGLDFRLIQPGTFKMGSPPTEPGRSSDETQHQVQITYPFYIGAFEVTQEQWVALMGNNPSMASQRQPHNPVTKVSWDDCQAFVQRLNQVALQPGFVFRLPTEVEWEYACRAGTETAFAFGESISTQQANVIPNDDAAAPPPGSAAGGRPVQAQCLGIVRHARECRRVVPRLVRKLSYVIRKVSQSVWSPGGKKAGLSRGRLFRTSRQVQKCPTQLCRAVRSAFKTWSADRPWAID